MQDITVSAGKIRKGLLPASLSLLLAAALLSGCSSDSANHGADNAASAAAAATAQPTAEPSEAAAQTAETVYPLAVTDELGHELTLEAAPQRIFAPYLEDSLVVLGVKPVAQWANNGQGQAYLQDKLAGVPLLDFNSGLPSPEVVMDLQPDLIVLHNANYAENGVYEQYSKIAPTYVFKQAAGDLDSSVTMLGELIGKQEAAAEGLAAYHRKVEAAKAALAPHMDGKKALIIRFNSRGMFLMGGVYGGFVLADQLGIAKSDLVATENSLELSLELLPQIDADYIFLANDTANSGENFYKELTESALWKSIPAVQAGHVYNVDDRYWLGGGVVAYSNVIDDVLEIIVP
ncbi:MULTISPECIES: ABC transporter substrate-binding protein [unclassified Paenibacillus]|uniref:ABC transporter substrate-binding protein n=1 Tax=unclassified Paenibacillus TaxID=185978 RepID=UPI002406E494|nr:MULTISPECIES: ABC transporter substrate-binding protein [unclassified Paenibacillus]MDF9844808.1 iron complex transport system substrate-binding protein [Paenibacillus sp. PastF-2]MDF9851391.1 iron complex transport system substrate-binding protein [Paenibacillus sp. PastM-2]MDF9857992.1 iron complex transport system substrate-binding protein [Paenibacillus sp. PastF-1]MDH6483260.1 iron complex transport system substrate-binding protein [Paenibacillus sp. PastH-2]MDH6510670.1 iron complex t